MDAKLFLHEFRKERDFKKIILLLEDNEEFALELLHLIEQKAVYPYAEYASWIWTHLAKDLPEFAQKYYPNLVDILFETKNETILRNVLAGIVHLQKTDYKEGEFIDLLIQFLLEKNHKVALHVYALYVLTDFIKKYPELKQEVSLVADLLMENPTPALKVAYRNFIQEKRKTS